MFRKNKMTSSFVIKKIDEQRNLWTYARPHATLGGMEDRYLRTEGECHPDFAAVPIGNPTGMKMCVRKPDACGNTIGDTQEAKQKQLIEGTQGYFRGSVDLYDVYRMEPYQQINPEAYATRRTPWEADLIRRDYLHKPINYGGSGINPVRTPHQKLDANSPYWEYDFTFTPMEDKLTGRRIATKFSENVPPPKYDINQLHQRYPVWKREGEYVSGVDVTAPPRTMDTKYMKRYV